MVRAVVKVSVQIGPEPDLHIWGPRLDSYVGPKALPTFRSPIVYN